MVVQFSTILSASNIYVASQKARDCDVTAVSFPTVQDAISALLKDERDPQVLLFGYTHRSSTDNQSAPKIFAEEVLQTLAANKYQDLVLEILPVGLPTSKIQKEIAEYNKTGIIGSEMERFLPKDDPEYRQILVKAHDMGITIHAGGQTYENCLQGSVIYTRSLPIIQEEIAFNSRNTIGNLALAGKKIAWFGGCIHNDIDPIPNKKKYSFGWQLKNQLPNSVVEIDMVVPELSRQSGLYQYLPLPQGCDWEDYIPSQGVTKVLNQQSGSYLLYFTQNLHQNREH